jgi:DNA invertase Pin-like site-specific DNA recombinase
MRQAVGYVRVSTKGQAANGHGMDVQRHHIEAYAKFAGYRIKHVFTDVASGMGEGAGRSESLRQAVLLAKQNQWPLIVASLDRIVRDTKRFEEFLLENHGVRIISAKHGEGADPIVIRAAAERAQYEGDRISETTKKALAERKAKGVKLGNRTNLDEAQRKGAAKNRAVGSQRRAEFEEMLRLARKAGAKSVVEIAADLNARGFRTARGGDWKASNVHRMLKEIDAAPSSSGVSRSSSKPAPSTKPRTIFDANGYLLPDGVRRIRQIMDHRKIKMGVVMKELGHKALDASLGNAMRGDRRFTDPKLFDWVSEQEKALGLS